MKLTVNSLTLVLSKVNSMKLYTDKDSIYYAEVYFLNNSYKDYQNKYLESMLKDIFYDTGD